jgi:cell wall-associated NlpC family hydrolase
MSASRPAPVRLLTSLALVLGLTFTMFSFTTVGPNASGASAMVTAAKANAAADWARSRKGSPYVYGAVGPHRFDCSGLTRWVYARVGRSLPHSSSAQAGDVNRISRSNARRGDLVFFYSHGSVYHVAIWAGHGYVWHAPHSGTRVRRDHLWTRSVFFGRVK